MKRSTYTPEQEIVWCKTLIHHEAMTLARVYRRWAKDELILNSLNDRGEELQNQIPANTNHNEFDDVEWDVLLAGVLTPRERCVIHGLYRIGASQRDVAGQCSLSQSGVSRTRRQALRKLREAMRK